MTKNLRIVFCVLALFFCVSAWGTCTIAQSTGQRCSGYYDNNCPTTAECTQTTFTPNSMRVCSYAYKQSNGYYTNPSCVWSAGASRYEVRATAVAYCCTLQSELDSLNCEITGKVWQNNTCQEPITTQDTTIQFCNENLDPQGRIYSQIYKCECKADISTGTLTECQGKTNVDPSLDCQLISEKQGTCGQNGLQQGVNSGDAQNKGNCFAITGSVCHFEDPATGQFFRCECDGSCDYGQKLLATGGCKNPYINSSNSAQDSLILGSSASSSPSSSADSSPSSSASSSPSSSADSSPSSSGSNDDLEYDYTAYLQNIEANTQYMANLQQSGNYTLSSIDNKMTTNNSLLQDIANKDFSPNVVLNVNGGDTAKSPKQILNLLENLTASVDVDTNLLNGGVDFENEKFKTDSLIQSFNVDSITNTILQYSGDSTTGLLSVSLDSLKNFVENGVFGDSIRKWQQALLPAGLSGGGSNSCPAILNKTWSVNFIGNTSVSIGPLGAWGLCKTVVGGISFWQIARVLLRVLVAITCLFAIYKTLVGLGDN